jgi:hypothetical protein
MHPILYIGIPVTNKGAERRNSYITCIQLQMRIPVSNKGDRKKK